MLIMKVVGVVGAALLAGAAVAVGQVSNTSSQVVCGHARFSILSPVCLRLEYSDRRADSGMM